MECHIQLFLDDAWRDCAIVTVPDPEKGGVQARTLFEYDLDYAFDETDEPVSLALPVDARCHTLAHWPAFLYDLIPQGNGRRYLLGQLNLRDGKEADFHLLCAGAFNPVGRIRITEAVDYFKEHHARHAAGAADEAMTFEDITGRGDVFVERMLAQSMLAAGTTGVQGAAPKYLLTRDHAGGWHADGTLPDTQAAQHFIVKMPRGQTPADRKVLRNEAAYMRVAKEMGCRVHGQVQCHHDMLFIPRFDRQVQQGKVLRHHQESAASVAGIPGFDARPGHFEVLAALRTVLTDRTSDTIEFLKRDVLNLAMRNTDNHARNTAIQKRGAHVSLTPLFDFAPMYLDPEGIARAMRWYHPQTRKELHDWGSILSTLDLDANERPAIHRAMSAFGETMNDLEEIMRRCGVDEDMIDYLQIGINEQRRQLRDLHG